MVEDDAVLALSLEAALLDAGANQVDIVSNTAAALKALCKGRPDTLVLDVHLADRDDGWAIAELVETVGTNQPRIIFQTGSPQDIPDAIARLGKVLVKPYDPQELIALAEAPAKPGFLARLRRRS
ncbi:hypothetical protein GCM10022213_13170 [Parerythrobacter jejuensis]